MHKTAAIKSENTMRQGLTITVEFLISAALGAVLANSSVQGIRSPLTASLTGTLPLGFGVMAFLGAMLTYFLTGTVTVSAIQITSMLMVLITKILICEVLSKELRALGNAIVSGTCYFVCAFAVTFLTTRMASAFFIITLQSLYCATSTYIAFSACERVSQRRKINFCGSDGIIFGSLFIIAASSLCSVQLSFFNVGRIFGILCMLFAAKRFRVSGGAVCGILAVVALGLYSSDFARAAVYLTAAALAAGAFSDRGTIFQALVFLGISSVGALFLGVTPDVAKTMADIVVASVMFVLIPERASNRIFGTATASAKSGEAALASSKLEFAAETIHEVHESVKQLSDALEKKSSGADASAEVCERVCKYCRNNLDCWEKNFSKSCDNFRLAEKQTLLHGSLSERNFPEGLSGCFRKQAVMSEFTAVNEEIRTAENAKRKIAEMRGLLFEQFSSMEDMLRNLSDEITSGRECDFRLSEEIRRYLLKCGVNSPRVCAYCDNNGKISTEGYFIGSASAIPEDFSEKLSDMTEREFGEPVYTYSGELTGFCICEKPKFSVEFGTAQRAAKSGEQSGDTVKTFSDGRGNCYSVISDGMGRGNPAAVDSMMTSTMLTRLLRAGIGFSAASRLINSAMLVKSSDESFATLDIACVNLYSGNLDMIKLGASSTIVKNGEKLRVYEAGSLPLGILGNPVPEKMSARLSENDIAIFSSDGITEEIHPAIKEIILTEENLSADEIAGKILAAQLSTHSDNTDDITVSVVRLTKNNC